MEPVPVAKNQCCWPGQVYDGAFDACLKTPECPSGQHVNNAGACEKGKAPASGAKIEGAKCVGSNARCLQLADDLYIGEKDPKKIARAAVIYKQVCDSGGARGCTLFGKMTDFGEGGLREDFEKAKQLYEKSCTDKVVYGCSYLGVLYERGLVGGKKDLDRATSLYKKACDGQNAHGCYRLAGANSKSGKTDEKSLQEGHRLIVLACDGGYADACFFAGYIAASEKNSAKVELSYLERACDGDYIEGCKLAGRRLREKNPERMAYFYDRACALGDSSSCKKLADGYANADNGLEKDRKKSASYFEKGCEVGDAEACNYLGVSLQNAGGTSNLKRANELFELACTKKDGQGCYNLGYSYFKGRGLEPSNKKAHDYLLMSCDLGYKKGCGLLGKFYVQGWSVRVDHARAFGLLRQGCQASDGESCYLLAMAFHKGLAVSVDLTNARKLYALACDLNFAEACTNLGAFHETGRGGPQDSSQATAAFEKACEAGDRLGCHNAGYMNKKLGGTDPKMLSKSAEFYHRACEAHYKSSCEAFEKNKVLFCQTAGYQPACSKGGGTYTGGGDHAKTAHADAKKTHTSTREKPRKSDAEYEKDCKSGDGEACGLLGVSLQKARGKANHMRAVELFEKGCKAKDGESCYQLASLHQQGRLRRSDPKRARELYERACYKYDHVNACNQFGALLLSSKDPKKLPDALMLFHWTCQQGDKTGCSLAKRYTKSVDPTARTTVRANAMDLQSMCEAGARHACNNLEMNKRFYCKVGEHQPSCDRL